MPAAGRATRLGSLPCSKEILPIAAAGPDGPAGPRVACDALLAAWAHAGVTRAVVALGHGKWDIPGYLGDGGRWGLRLAYVPIEGSHGVAYTVDRAAAWLGNATVAVGFPDIVFGPVGTFARLLGRLGGGTDVVLGLVPADRPHTADMVERAADGTLSGLVVKPAATTLTHTWITAVWAPSFSAYLHAYVRHRTVDRGRATDGREVHLGDVFAAATADGLHIATDIVPGGHYVDIGTAEGYAAALAGHTEPGGRSALV